MRFVFRSEAILLARGASKRANKTLRFVERGSYIMLTNPINVTNSPKPARMKPNVL